MSTKTRRGLRSKPQSAHQEGWQSPCVQTPHTFRNDQAASRRRLLSLSGSRCSDLCTFSRRSLSSSLGTFSKWEEDSRSRCSDSCTFSWRTSCSSLATFSTWEEDSGSRCLDLCTFSRRLCSSLATFSTSAFASLGGSPTSLSRAGLDTSLPAGSATSVSLFLGGAGAGAGAGSGGAVAECPSCFGAFSFRLLLCFFSLGWPLAKPSPSAAPMLLGASDICEFA